VVIGPDADLDRVVPSLVKGGYYHAGQVCVSVQRIFAHRAVQSDLLQRLTDAVERLTVGDPTSPETDVGPLILPREVKRVDSWVREAIDAGASAAFGAERLGETTYSPTVLDEPPGDAKVSTREIFGPVTCIYAYEDVDDAIARANALPLAFQASVYARDLEFALQTADRLAGSVVMINDHPAFRVDWMPFAGLRESGYGVGGIGYTLRDMTIEKMVIIKGEHPARTRGPVP
jgi:acyl-CoA reductase-like NAD-dependent aldehyde dehydrogenase